MQLGITLGILIILIAWVFVLLYKGVKKCQSRDSNQGHWYSAQMFYQLQSLYTTTSDIYMYITLPMRRLSSSSVCHRKLWFMKISQLALRICSFGDIWNKEGVRLHVIRLGQLVERWCVVTMTCVRILASILFHSLK